MDPIARALAQNAAVAKTQAEMAQVGFDVPVRMGGPERNAASGTTGVVIGRGFEPNEIPGVLRHEAGHFAKRAVEELMRKLGVAGQFANEPQADFVSGALAILAHDTVDQYVTTLQTFDVDPTHGPLAQRVTAVLAGAAAATRYLSGGRPK